MIDCIQQDISGSTTRQKYQVFVTGGIGPGITSSLWQTVFDQDFSLQTSNAVFDMTVGLFVSSSIVQDIKSGEDSAGKLLFPSTSVMMREKVGIYQQFAQLLLGDSSAQFTSPLNSALMSDRIDAALFICFKRLFHRDQIKRETFAMKWYQSASLGSGSNLVPGAHYADPAGPGFNLNSSNVSGAVIFTDVGSSTDKEVTFGGQVSRIVDSSNTARSTGLLFNDRGIVVIDLGKVISGSQHVSGVIDAMNGPGGFPQAGQVLIGANNTQVGQDGGATLSGNPNASFIPDFLTSASLDNIIDHIASTRFLSSSDTAITFQNITNINSTLFFARATADEFNYSSNPTFVDSQNRIVVIDPGQEDTQRTFTFVTSIGFYDANDNLLAVAKLSRPVQKADERDITFRCRLDF